MLLTCINADNRSKRYIFASASFCLLLAVVGLVCGFLDTLNSLKGSADNFEETEGIWRSTDETSKILVEDEDKMQVTWKNDA